MPITYSDNTAIMEEVVMIEEADAFYEWLQNHPDGEVDLKELTHIHTCNLQLLLKMRPKISEPPKDASFREWLSPILT